MAYTQIGFLSLSPFQFYSLFIIIIYFCVCVCLRIGWKMIPVDSCLQAAEGIQVSVIIASRNDSTTLFQLLGDLKKQNYPQYLYDVIVVDDHSETEISLQREIALLSMNNLRVLKLPGNIKGKKKALQHGVVNSRSELLLFTDADCRLHPDWISSYVNKYISEQSSLIIGLVDYGMEGKDNYLGAFFRLDFLSLITSGAGSAFLKHPVMCNGANLAVRRDIYLSVTGNLNSKTQSGDDMFLLHAVKKLKGEKISILKSKNSLVYTKPPLTCLDFLNQRMRWASKARFYSDNDTIFLGFLVVSVNIVLFMAFLGIVYAPFRLWFALTFLIKTIADCLVLSAGYKFFGGMRSLFLLPFIQFFYPFYVFASAIGGMLNLFSWKGRKPMDFTDV